MPPKAIPDRWTAYKACGQVIEGTRIICFKVPLKLHVQQNVPGIDKIWDIPTVLADIPKLGAVIDLTNTARYYNPLDFLKANVTHRKLLMPGREVPPERLVQEFMDILDGFLATNSELLVGVHCTHGLNRTGYMVCRYMRDRLAIPAAEAITRFELARGYKIERDIYRNGILGKPGDTRGDGKEEEVIPVETRRNDVNYRSPLHDDGYSPNFDSRNRYGSRPNNHRNGFNRYVSNRNANSDKSTNNNGLFACYTKRYDSVRDISARSRGDAYRGASSGPSSSWRSRGECIRDDARRNRYVDRYEDRPMHDDSSRQHRPDSGGRPRYDGRHDYTNRSRNDY